MSAVRMDGKALSAKVRGSILAETDGAEKAGCNARVWRLSSSARIRRARSTSATRSAPASSAAFTAEKYALPEETTQEELLGLIARAESTVRAISGILCQMPVPKHIHRAGGHRRH